VEVTVIASQLELLLQVVAQRGMQGMEDLYQAVVVQDHQVQAVEVAAAVQRLHFFRALEGVE
jgi:hypothetical protein